MSTDQKAKTFAKLCLEDHKVQIASEIRKYVNKNKLLYKNAIDVFGMSMTSMSAVMNFKERSLQFETLFSAAVTAGITVSIVLTVPE